MTVEAPGGLGPTSGLQRVWVAGAVVLIAGMLVPGGGEALSIAGLLLLAAPAGTTAALGRAAGTWWRVLAWAVPVLPSLGVLGLLASLLLDSVDGYVLGMVLLLLGGLCACVWAVFGVAYAVARRR